MVTVERVLPWRRERRQTEEQIAPLIHVFRGPDAENQIDVVARAYRMAAKAHDNQRRRSGEPYIVHPFGVAKIVADLGMNDASAVAAALLHDAVEDTRIELEDIQRAFGSEVAMIVDGVTKLDRLRFDSKEHQQAASFRKMLVAMAKDIRVLIIKLCDRLHNLRTIAALPAWKQERTARETLDIYAPLAHRLGMEELKVQLEDLSFAALHPKRYAEIDHMVAVRAPEREFYLTQVLEDVRNRVTELGIPAEVAGREKHLYSIYEKMVLKGKAFDEIHDLVGIRVVVDSVRDCYAALGSIHAIWKPVPGRFKDYIAMPKFNLYQSLHTTVVGPQGKVIEVQIRTRDMHDRAESGVASHFAYKDGADANNVDLPWLKRIIDWEKETSDPDEFMANLKVDLDQGEVYVFTPQGAVTTLPAGSTPIDFAYAIHTDVGHQCVGAKVNGRIVPLRTPLRNGDVVEIVTQTGHMPSKDWLSLVKTSRARNKIKHVINASERERAIDIGQKAMEREARRLGVALSRISRDEMDQVASDYGCSKLEDLHAALGYGKVSARQILSRFAPSGELLPPAPPEPAAPHTGTTPGRPGADNGDLVIRVTGADDLLVYRAKCCNPIRGEAIVGYITRGKGVGVHSLSCPNVQNLMYEVDRRIDVEWARAATDNFMVKMVVYTEDRPGVLNQLTSVLTHENSNIRSLEARSDERRGPDNAIVDMTVEVRDKKQLERVVAGMRRIPGVRDVERVQ